MNNIIESINYIKVNNDYIDFKNDNFTGKYNTGSSNTPIEVEISLKDSTYIPAEMFKGCKELTTVVSLPKFCSGIQNNAFAYSGITSINGMNQVSYCGPGSFHSISSDLQSYLGNNYDLQSDCFGYFSFVITETSEIGIYDEEGHNPGNAL